MNSFIFVYRLKKIIEFYYTYIYRYIHISLSFAGKIYYVNILCKCLLHNVCVCFFFQRYLMYNYILYIMLILKSEYCSYNYSGQQAKNGIKR